TASVLAICGGIIARLRVGDGPYVASSAHFDPRAVLQVFAYRPARLATLGYLGHMWELYAVWTWIAAFAAASLSQFGGTSAVGVPIGSTVAFVTIASGAAGSALAGLFADRLGKARVASWAMLVSGMCAAFAGFAFGRAAPILFGLAVVWGVSVVADSAQL